MARKGMHTDKDEERSSLNVRLVGMQRAEFNNAALLQRRAIAAQVAVAAVAALAVFITNATASYFAAVVALSMAIGWAWLSWNYRQSRAQAERARRATLIMDGLGETVSESELRDILCRFTVSDDEGKKHEDSSYYAARAAPGDKRLTEMLEESAFWSEDLFRHSAFRSWAVFGVFLVLGVIMLVAAVPFAAGENLSAIARVTCALLTLLASNEFLGASLAYTEAASALRALMPRLARARQAGYPRPDLLILLSDYNAAVEGAPMYPPGIYESRRSKLNELWRLKSHR